MSKYRFECVDAGRTTIMELDTDEIGETWNDLLPHIHDFILGCGFKFKDGLGELIMVDSEGNQL